MPNLYNMIRGCGADQQFLLPQNPKDWLPKGDIVYSILKIINLLNMSPSISKYRSNGIGSAFFDPRCMLGIILYSMIRGEKSSRKIEICCQYDIGYRLVANHLCPDHTTIYRFKKNNPEAIKDIFKQLALIIVDSGITRIGVVALDGTKIEANAALSANKKSKYIESELIRLFEESQQIDNLENKCETASDDDNTRLYEHLDAIERRIETLTAAQAKLNERQQIEADKQKERIHEREMEEEETGKKKRGRKLSEPQKTPLPDAKVNVTDPDSQIMSTARGLIQGLNGQIIVTEDQYIIAAALTDEQDDKKQLVPMLEELEDLFLSTQSSEKPHTILADAGYYSYENMSAEERFGINFLIPPSKERKIRDYVLDEGNISRLEQVCCMVGDGVVMTIAELASIGTFVWQAFFNREKIATNQEISKRIMEARVKSPSGREVYRKRKYMVEPVFGDIKQNGGFRRFSMKGKKKCEGEFFLAAISHNVKKIFNNNKIAAVLSFMCGKEKSFNNGETDLVAHICVYTRILLRFLFNMLNTRGLSRIHLFSSSGICRNI